MITSAGILLHRAGPQGTEVLIAHMGGPFWARKDAGAWSIPKGEFDPDRESARDAALREFGEELGVAAPDVRLEPLGEFTVTSRKRLVVFTAEAVDFVAPSAGFGMFEMQWPPRSGRTASFPEVDRVEWMPVGSARERVVAGQRAVLDALIALRGGEAGV